MTGESPSKSPSVFTLPHCTPVRSLYVFSRKCGVHSLPHEVLAKIFLKYFKLLIACLFASSLLFLCLLSAHLPPPAVKQPKQPVPPHKNIASQHVEWSNSPWGTLNWLLGLHIGGRARLNASKLTSITCT